MVYNRLVQMSILVSFFLHLCMSLEDKYRNLLSLLLWRGDDHGHMLYIRWPQYHPGSSPLRILYTMTALEVLGTNLVSISL